MTQAMEELESGYEVVDGVRLGYLVIQGKQMFALSQVFTDLLKNIPRTTVHKRMDHLKVKKHPCDLEELRKLKAINSIAFHAAKCTLISREDVEALYTSCKTERVLKTKRRSRALATKELPGEPPSPDPFSGFWKENKVWLGLNDTGQPMKRKALLPAADLPHFLSQYTGRGYPGVPRSPCKSPLDYETAQVPGDCVGAFHSSLPYLRGVLCTKHPAYYYQHHHHHQHHQHHHQDIAHTKLGGFTYRYKRKRTSLGKDPFQGDILFLPKPYRSKGAPLCLEGLRLVNGFLQDYTSDSESSSANDSDFGSSLSSSSNNSSDEEEEEGEGEEEEEEEEEEGSLSDSTEVSSDEESSSESDSSSVSSQVSVESIRFRRTNFSVKPPQQPHSQEPSSPSPTGIKTESQDWKQQQQQQQQQQGWGSRTPGTCPAVDSPPDPTASYPSPGFSTRHDWKQQGWGSRTPGTCPAVESPLDPTASYPSSGFCSKRSESQDWHWGSRTPGTCPAAESPPDPTASYPSPGFSTSQDWNQQGWGSRTPRICPAVDSPSDPRASYPSPGFSSEPPSAASPKKNNASPQQRAPKEHRSPPSSSTESSPNDSTAGAGCELHFLHNIKVKIEESSEEYELAAQPRLSYQCQVAKDEDDTDEPPTTSPSQAPPPTCTLAKKPEDGDYKYGAKVRKNYRKLVLGKKKGALQSPPPATPTITSTNTTTTITTITNTTTNTTTTTSSKPNVKSARSPRPPGKSAFYERTLDALTVTNRRKRLANNVAPTLKRPFSFMANFPSPPSLIIGKDGDLVPAYSLTSTKDCFPPHKAHPIWKWHLGGTAVPLPPSHKFRTFQS